MKKADAILKFNPTSWPKWALGRGKIAAAAVIHHSFYCSVLLYTTILVVLSAVSSSESLSWPPEHHIITITGILILTKINIYHCSSARCSSEADEAQLFSASATKTICTVIASSWKAPGDTKCKMAGKYHKIFLVSLFDPLHT